MLDPQITVDVWSIVLHQPTIIMALALVGLLSASSLLSSGLKIYWGLKGFMATLSNPWTNGTRIPSGILDFHRRVKSWWLITALIVPLFLLGQEATIIAMAAIAFLGLREWLSSADLGRTPHLASALVLYFLVPLQFAVGSFLPAWAIGLAPAVLGMTAIFQEPKRNHWPLFWGAMIVSSTAFVAAILMLPLNNDPAQRGIIGQNMMLFAHILVVAQLSDGMQYAVGKVLGKTPLVRAISSNKTWEGAIGGGFIALAVGTAFAAFTSFTFIQSAILSLIVVISGIIGGLLFSKAKRQRDIKDWSALIPGHGGVLDRIDSLVIAIPAYMGALVLMGVAK